MTRLISKFILATAFFASSCASSITPAKVNGKLPSLTKSKYLSLQQADDNVKNNKCKYLVKNRTYTAPLGLTAQNDLKYEAKGIDEWVKLDGGNAYVLKNYRWVIIDQLGSAQLHIDFDTMVCE